MYDRTDLCNLPKIQETYLHEKCRKRNNPFRTTRLITYNNNLAT